jgi:hypothetical protein
MTIVFREFASLTKIRIKCCLHSQIVYISTWKKRNDNMLLSHKNPAGLDKGTPNYLQTSPEIHNLQDKPKISLILIQKASGSKIGSWC